jgi:uncharacterized protein YqgC (DUF456 family)
MHWTYYISLLILMLAGLWAVIVGLPGLWIMIAAVIAYAALTGWQYVGLWTIVILIVIGILAEIVETAAGGAGAKREGASKRGILGAIVGGILGGLFLTFLIPIPIVGTIVGACLGSLLGAMVTEIAIGKELEHSLRIGVGAAKGRLLGILSKLAFGLVILAISMWMALPWGAPQLPTKPFMAPTTLPTTSPSTAPTTLPTTQQ